MTTTAPLSLADLRASRRSNRFLLLTGWGLLALTLLAWLSGEFWDGILKLVAPGRLIVLERFASDLVPRPWQAAGSGDMKEWLVSLLTVKALPGLWSTLLFAFSSAAVAFVVSVVLAPWAARPFATPQFMDVALPQPGLAVRAFWRATYLLTRTLFMLCRGLPEYLLTFFFIALWGPTGWAAIAALSIHNIGVMGRLYSELLENADRGALQAQAVLGAGRMQVLVFGAAPAAFGRGMAYWFYRWETCVRDSVTLGMLGISSLGYWIMDARVRDLYDEMFLLMLTSAALVLAGEFASNRLRHRLRRM